jgi:hypothetical protein
MVSIGIQEQPYTVLPTLLGSDFGVLGHLCSQNDVFLSWLMLTATSNCFPPPYWMHTNWLSKLLWYPWAYSISHTQLYSPYLAQILGFWVTIVESIWWDYVMIEVDSHLKLLPTSILDMQELFEHIDMLSTGIWWQPYTVLPTLLGTDFWVLGHLCSQNIVIMSWLMLTATSNCFSYPY